MTSGTVPVPAASAQTAGSSVLAPRLYVSFTQQHRTDGSFLARDREPCLACDMNGLGLTPGYYLGRLSNSHPTSTLPVYEVVAGGVGAQGPPGPTGPTGPECSSCAFITTIGNGSATSFTITHNLGTRDVIVFVWEAGGSFQNVWTQYAVPTVDTVTVYGFLTPPSTNQYRVIISPGLGCTGPAGSTGNPGTQGSPGPTGSRGDPGTQGERGATGSTGNPGTQGTPGTPGATGATGSTGQPGTQGSKGDRGDTGATGATGATGPAGSKGDPGTQGPPGPSGSTAGPWVGVTVSVGGTINNWAPSSASALILTTTSDTTITGMVLQVGVFVRLIVNGGSHPVTFKYDDSGSLSQYRFYTWTGADVVVGPNGSLFLLYDATVNRWRALPAPQPWLSLFTATPTQITGSQNDYDPGVAGYIRLDADGAHTITGLLARPAGTQLVFTNVGTNPISFANDSSSSAAGNRIYTSSGGTVTLNGAQSAFAWYDAVSSHWRLTPVQGATGATGSTGNPGTQGSPGPTGSRGDPGTQGQPGVSGARTEGALAATGNNQGNAAAITTDAVSVSGADGTKGVILPSDRVAGMIFVANEEITGVLKIYPPSGAQIDAGGTDVSYSLNGSGRVLICRVSSTQWYARTFT